MGPIKVRFDQRLSQFVATTDGYESNGLADSRAGARHELLRQINKGRGVPSISKPRRCMFLDDHKIAKRWR